MIIRFKVTNFRSYKNETTLDFVSTSKIRKQSDHEFSFGRLSILKNIGIFGSNAFGKSNLLYALATMRGILLSGKCPDNLSFIDNKKEPTSFDIVFSTDDNHFYEYIFSIRKTDIFTNFIVEDEQLFELSLSGNNRLIYSKEFGFDTDIEEPMKYYLEGYKKIQGQLFLKYINAEERLIENNKLSNLLNKIFKFFTFNLLIALDSKQMLHYVSEKSIELTKKYLMKYDIGIENVEFKNADPTEINEITKDPLFEFVKKGFLNDETIKEQYVGNNKDIFCIKKAASGLPQIKKLYFKHKGIDKPFSFGHESNGTQRIFCLLAMLLDNRDNTSIVIDEIERSSHPGIASAVIRDFQKKNISTKNQLVFTSHLSELMNNILRHDEIYFVKKNDSGESILYSLEEFGSRTRDDIEKRYRNGHYGAVPKIGVEIENGTY